MHSEEEVNQKSATLKRVVPLTCIHKDVNESEIFISKSILLVMKNNKLSEMK